MIRGGGIIVAVVKGTHGGSLQCASVFSELERNHQLNVKKECWMLEKKGVRTKHLRFFKHFKLLLTSGALYLLALLPRTLKNIFFFQFY